jgi:hypothetical protein
LSQPRPKQKYAHNPKTLKYSDVTGQTIFMIHIFCGCGISSIMIANEHANAMPTELQAIPASTASLLVNRFNAVDPKHSVGC